MSRIYLVQGDTLPMVTLRITDADDNDVDISGCTGATVHMRKVGSATVTQITAAVDTVAGTVAWDFGGGELSEAGEFEAEVQLNFGAAVQTLYRPLKIRVRGQFA